MPGLTAKPITRDRLRDDPQTAARYAALKGRLAAEFEGDREAHTAAKADFVQAALHRVRSGRIRAYDADARDR